METTTDVEVRQDEELMEAETEEAGDGKSLIVMTSIGLVICACVAACGYIIKKRIVKTKAKTAQCEQDEEQEPAFEDEDEMAYQYAEYEA